MEKEQLEQLQTTAQRLADSLDLEHTPEETDAIVKALKPLLRQLFNGFAFVGYRKLSEEEQRLLGDVEKPFYYANADLETAGELAHWLLVTITARIHKDGVVEYQGLDGKVSRQRISEIMKKKET